MKKNMGGLDRIIRLIVAVIIVILYFTKVIQGTTSIVLGIIAFIFALTSFINFCPLYSIFKINTYKK